MDVSRSETTVNSSPTVIERETWETAGFSTHLRGEGQAVIIKSISDRVRTNATDIAGTCKTTIEMTSSLSPGDATSSPNLHHVTKENGMLATRARLLCMKQLT